MARLSNRGKSTVLLIGVCEYFNKIMKDKLRQQFSIYLCCTPHDPCKQRNNRHVDIMYKHTIIIHTNQIKR